MNDGNKALEADLDALAKEYLPKVSRWVAFKLKGAGSVCDDLAQEVMTAVIKNFRAGQFEGRSQRSTYIRSIANNKISDYWKYKKVRRGQQSLDDENAPESLKIGLSDAGDEEFERQEKAAMLREFVLTLKPKYYEVIQLYYYEGMKIEEIAARQGISVKKDYNYMTYAIRLLREKCKSHDLFSVFWPFILLIKCWEISTWLKSIGHGA